MVNKQFKDDWYLFTIFNESETNILNAKFVKYKGDRIHVNGLTDNKVYCISEYKYGNTALIGSKRKSKLIKNSKLTKENITPLYDLLVGIHILIVNISSKLIAMALNATSQKCTI